MRTRLLAGTALIAALAVIFLPLPDAARVAMKAIPLSLAFEIASGIAFAQGAADPMAHLRACSLMERAERLECLDKLIYYNWLAGWHYIKAMLTYWLGLLYSEVVKKAWNSTYRLGGPHEAL